MNLATDYLGLRLRSPFIVGASPLCDEVPTAQRLQDEGAGAVVMRSLFEEQIEPQSLLVFPAQGAGPIPPGRFPELADYQVTPERYLHQLENLKRHLTIPVIASLNGRQPGVWTLFASQLERAGADAIELNFYQVVADPSVAADHIERLMLETVGVVAGAVEIPVAVKFSPYHTSVAQLAVALELAGAAGVVLFNRFYQPDVNVADLTVQPRLQLSEPGELLLRLRWLAILAPQLRGSLAATGGVHGWDDAAKALLTGAHAVQLVSVLLRDGPGALRTLAAGLARWMETRGYRSLADFRGLLDLHGCGDPSSFERANYLQTLQSWRK